MTELQKELSAVFDMISAISVKGESVELMAAAKERLRSVYKMTEKETADG